MRNKSKFFSQSAKMFLLLLVVGTFLVSCKATSTLDIAINSKHNGSGTLKFQIKLDQEALDTLRSAAYKSIELKEVFKTNELSKIGFEIEIKDGEINMSRSFGSEKELQSALDAIAGKGVVQALLKSEKTLTSIKSDTEIKVRLKKIRDIFLNDASVKNSLSEAGIEFSDYEALVSKAFEATKLKISIKDSKTVSESKNLSDSKDDNLLVSNTVKDSRNEFLLGNIGAALCLLILIIVLIRKWRTPRLISNGE